MSPMRPLYNIFMSCIWWSWALVFSINLASWIEMSSNWSNFEGCIFSPPVPSWTYWNLIVMQKISNHIWNNSLSLTSPSIGLIFPIAMTDRFWYQLVRFLSRVYTNGRLLTWKFLQTPMNAYSWLGTLCGRTDHPINPSMEIIKLPWLRPSWSCFFGSKPCWAKAIVSDASWARLVPNLLRWKQWSGACLFYWGCFDVGL